MKGNVLPPYRSHFNWHIFYQQKKGKILNSAVEFDIMSTHTSWGNLSIVYYTLVGFRCFDEGRRSFFEHISSSLPAFSIRETVYLKPASSFTYTVRDYEMIKRVISTFPIFMTVISVQLSAMSILFVTLLRFLMFPNVLSTVSSCLQSPLFLIH